MPFDVDALVRQMEAQGTLDSRGIFSINPLLAEEKLRRFQLPWPRGYIVKVVQYAVASGATRIEVEEGSDGIRLEFDGEAARAVDIERLLGYLLTEDLSFEKRHLRHLSAALRGAAGLEPDSVSFLSSGPGEAFRAVWDSSGWKLLREPPEEPHRRVFTLSHTVGQSFLSRLKVVGDMLGFHIGQDAEPELLSDLCALCPATLTYNGTPLSTGTFGAPPGRPTSSGDMVDRKSHLLEWYEVADPGQATSLHRLRSHRRSGEEPRNCRAWLAVAAGLSSRSKVIYIDDGVFLCRRVLTLPCPGFFAIYSAEGLRKDLSGFRLVEDVAYLEHQRTLKFQALVLREKLEKATPDMPEPVQRRVRKAIARLQASLEGR